jgi:hypothetical protein
MWEEWSGQQDSNLLHAFDIPQGCSDNTADIEGNRA